MSDQAALQAEKILGQATLPNEILEEAAVEQITDQATSHGEISEPAVWSTRSNTAALIVEGTTVEKMPDQDSRRNEIVQGVAVDMTSDQAAPQVEGMKDKKTSLKIRIPARIWNAYVPPAQIAGIKRPAEAIDNDAAVVNENNANKSDTDFEFDIAGTGSSNVNNTADAKKSLRAAALPAAQASGKQAKSHSRKQANLIVDRPAKLRASKRQKREVTEVEDAVLVNLALQSDQNNNAVPSAEQANTSVANPATSLSSKGKKKGNVVLMKPKNKRSERIVNDEDPVDAALIAQAIADGNMAGEDIYDTDNDMPGNAPLVSKPELYRNVCWGSTALRMEGPDSDFEPGFVQFVPGRWERMPDGTIRDQKKKLVVKLTDLSGQRRIFKNPPPKDWKNQEVITLMNKRAVQQIRRNTDIRFREVVTPYAQAERQWILDHLDNNVKPVDGWPAFVDGFNKAFKGKIIEGDNKPRPKRSHSSLTKEVERFSHVYHQNRVPVPGLDVDKKKISKDELPKEEAAKKLAAKRSVAKKPATTKTAAKDTTIEDITMGEGTTTKDVTMEEAPTIEAAPRKPTTRRASPKKSAAQKAVSTKRTATKKTAHKTLSPKKKVPSLKVSQDKVTKSRVPQRKVSKKT
ncbi:hypothetical protein B0J11DRAFT_597005 [Dendryphion nanum]|uniref:Uncharacterized protein n=1 Tax=Dendryphion nanum TaxID=256645 RepID=A0A9P9ECD8_9PLEO|nr:hypothetical protein B0J11DRAFT_597005 [Dendryphion nanum]